MRSSDELLEEDLLAVTDDLPPITEELNATERAEFEHNLHLVQPAPANKFVFFIDLNGKCTAYVNRAFILC